MNRRYHHYLIALLVAAAWLLAPDVAFADNCSSLNDCYYTLRAALAAAVGLGVFAALMAIGLDIGPLARGGRKEVDGAAGLEGAAPDEVDVWDRSLGVVPVDGLVGEQMGQQVQAGAKQPAASTQGEAPGAAAGEAPEGMRQARPGPREEAGAPAQGQPPAEEGMHQASADSELVSDTLRAEPGAAQESGGPPEARRTQEGLVDSAASDARTAEQARADVDAAQPSGRRGGELPPESGGQPGDAPDSGDVVDRARDVADAFGEPEGMAQADRPVDAPAQAEAPGEMGQQSAKPADAGPREGAQQSAKPAARAPGETGQESAGLSEQAPVRDAGGEMQQASAQGAPPAQEAAPVAEGGVVESPSPAVELPAGAGGTLGAAMAGQLSRTYSELGRVPGMRPLLQQVAANGMWAARGAVAQLELARRLSQQGVVLTQLGDSVEGRAAADVVTQDGAVMEAKNYYWAGPFFQDEQNVIEATRRLVRQVELLRRRYAGREVHVAFSDLQGAPQQMRSVLASIGVQLALAADAGAPRPEDVAGSTLVNRLQGMTVEEYGRALIRAGWKDTTPALGARLRAAFSHDPGSAWLALAVCAFDAECIFETYAQGESYAAQLRLLSRHSEGTLQAEDVVEEVQGQTLLVAFENGGRRYARRVAAESDTFAAAILEAVNEAIGDAGERRRFWPLAAPDQMIYLAFASSETMRRLEAAGLIPVASADAPG